MRVAGHHPLGAQCSLCWLTFVWLFHLVPDVSALFPIELIRVVMVLPETPIVNTPEFAWFILGVGLKVAAIGFYIGLPRNPPHHPIGRRNVLGAEVARFTQEEETEEELSADYYWQLFNTGNDTNAPANSPRMVAKYLDGIADLDRKQCMSRLLCHLQSVSDHHRLTPVQKIVLDVIWNSSSNDSDWNYDPVKSGRRVFVQAIHFGRTHRCSRCCDTMYRSCSVDSATLLLAL